MWLSISSLLILVDGAARKDHRALMRMETGLRSKPASPVDTPFWSLPPSPTSCEVLIGESGSADVVGTSDDGAGDHDCQKCNVPCIQLNKQKTVELTWSFNPELVEENAFDVETRIEWTNIIKLAAYKKKGLHHAIKFGMASNPDKTGYFRGKMGPEISALDDDEEPLRGRHLISFEDTAVADSGGEGPDGRRLVIPAHDAGSCVREISQPENASAADSTGTTCNVGYSALQGGEAFVYRLRMTKGAAEAKYAGMWYFGSEWEVSVKDLTNQQQSVLGKVLLEGDTKDQGIETISHEHEHLGCTPCDAFYEKTSIHGPFVLQPAGKHNITAGKSDLTEEAGTCNLHREVSLGGYGIQIETGPGVTPAPETDSSTTLFTCPM